MAKDEDTRTPEEIEAYAKECRRMAAETRKQAEAAMKTADEWEALGRQSMQAASQRRNSDKPEAKRLAAKTAPKRAKR